MSDDKKKKRTITAIFLILLPLSALIIFLLARAEKKRTVMQAGYVMISEISKVQYAIDSRLLNAEIVLYPGISCGYSRYPEDQPDIEKLIQEADRNMYAMKNR